MNKTTEKESLYDNLEKMSIETLLNAMNKLDQTVPYAVQSVIPSIESFIEGAFKRMEKGGRLFYIGAGTSGRLGIVDASECPPTFGVTDDIIIGMIAGGDGAIRKSVEFAEDNENLSWKDLQSYNISTADVVLGIAASGTTPYVVTGLKQCQQEGIFTGCITNNKGQPIEQYADVAMVCVVGPEFVTGSTRMKAGTSQKLILNMISTSLMIKMGRVKGNKMVDMQLSNNKLWERGSNMLMKQCNVSKSVALQYLKDHGSVRNAAIALKKIS